MDCVYLAPKRVEARVVLNMEVIHKNRGISCGKYR